MISNLLHLCTVNRLSLNQYAFLYCYYFKEEEVFSTYSRINGIGGNILGEHQINDLIDKGYVEKKLNDVISTVTNTTEKVVNYSITDKFASLFGEAETFFQELRRSYPTYITVNDKEILSCSEDVALLKKAYYDRIVASRKKHQQILYLIEINKDTQLLNIDLGTFIRSEIWNDLKKPENVDNPT